MLSEILISKFGFKLIKPRDSNYDVDKYVRMITVSGQKYEEIRELLYNDPTLDVNITKYVEIKPTIGYDINEGITIRVRSHAKYGTGEVVFKGVVNTADEMGTLLKLLELE